MSNITFAMPNTVSNNIIVTIFTNDDKQFLSHSKLMNSNLYLPHKAGKYITLQDKDYNYIAVNIGDNEVLTQPSMIGKVIAKLALELELEQFTLDINLSSAALAEIVFSINERIWGFHKYKTKAQYTLKGLEVLCSNPISLEELYDHYAALISGVNFCKELATEPANIMYPENFAKECLKLKAYGIEIEILATKELEELGMRALLGVAQGSNKEPQVVVMNYVGNPTNPLEKLAWVGKGVCFDSGGLFIKDQEMMPKMKYDKSGAAAVVGAMMAIAIQKLKVNVVGIIGLVENMPDGNAQKPSDVVTSMGGKTIEVANTDAEGRLVLADCLYYAYHRFKPHYMLSIATLTGETPACLADAYAGFFTRDKELAKRLQASGEQSGDKLWQLPLGKTFKEQITSEIADLKNEGVVSFGENAAAAEFLYEFVEGTRFAHLDIAGVAWYEEETTEHAKGASGYGVKLLAKFAEEIYTRFT